MTAVLAAAIDAIAEYAGPALETDREDTIAVPLRLLRALHKALQDDRRAWFLNQESPFPLCPICHPVEAAEAAL